MTATGDSAVGEREPANAVRAAEATVAEQSASDGGGRAGDAPSPTSAGGGSVRAPGSAEGPAAAGAREEAGASGRLVSRRAPVQRAAEDDSGGAPAGDGSSVRRAGKASASERSSGAAREAKSAEGEPSEAVGEAAGRGAPREAASGRKTSAGTASKTSSAGTASKKTSAGTAGGKTAAGGAGARGSGAKPESRTAMVRRARRINRELAEVYYYAHPELDFENPFELLVATVLSAQTTDLRVNQTTPALFAAYPTPEDMAAAVPEELEELIRPTGFYRNKAKSLLGLSAALRDNFGGEVPHTVDELVTLPGVGRKTAHVVLGNALGTPGLTVDTHFGRLVRRWKLTEQTDPEKVEAEIAKIIPKSEWTMFSHRTIFHGRRICHSKKPACGACPIAELCPSYGEGETDPTKAEKLLKYEMGGKPGQRLKPPADYPGEPAPPLGAAK